MQAEKNKIKAIVDQLLSNSIDAHANDIEVNVSRTDEEIIITVIDDGDGMDEEDLNYAKKTLDQPYRRDIEGYYGQLAGMESSRGGLNLVGMQVHHAKIESTLGEGTKVIVRKNRHA